jgi:hypothetical protein
MRAPTAQGDHAWIRRVRRRKLFALRIDAEQALEDLERGLGKVLSSEDADSHLTLDSRIARRPTTLPAPRPPW